MTHPYWDSSTRGPSTVGPIHLGIHLHQDPPTQDPVITRGSTHTGVHAHWDPSTWDPSPQHSLWGRQSHHWDQILQSPMVAKPFYSPPLSLGINLKATQPQPCTAQTQGIPQPPAQHRCPGAQGFPGIPQLPPPDHYLGIPPACQHLAMLQQGVKPARLRLPSHSTSTASLGNKTTDSTRN